MSSTDNYLFIQLYCTVLPQFQTKKKKKGSFSCWLCCFLPDITRNAQSAWSSRFIIQKKQQKKQKPGRTRVDMLGYLARGYLGAPCCYYWINANKVWHCLRQKQCCRISWMHADFGEVVFVTVGKTKAKMIIPILTLPPLPQKRGKNFHLAKSLKKSNQLKQIWTERRFKTK